MGDETEGRRLFMRRDYNRMKYGSGYDYEGFDKQFVIERDNYVCQMCGKLPYSWTWDTFREIWVDERWHQVVAHHLDHNKLNNRFENLVTLCNHCHKLHHCHIKKGIKE